MSLVSFIVAAFQQMGYRVSPQFVNLVVFKFDTRARRALSLDSFIQASVLLKSITDVFRQKDTNLSGTITLRYEDFMTMALLNKP